MSVSYLFIYLVIIASMMFQLVYHHFYNRVFSQPLHHEQYMIQINFYLEYSRSEFSFPFPRLVAQTMAREPSVPNYFPSN